MVAVRVIIVELRFRPRRRIGKDADVLLHIPQGVRAVADPAHLRIFGSPGQKVTLDTCGMRNRGVWLEVRIARDHGLLRSRIFVAVVAFEFLRLGPLEHASDHSRVRGVQEFRVVDLLRAARATASGLA